MLETHQLNVQLGRKPILQGINLNASAGMLTVIIGPNGSGKTTLLRALTGEISYAGSARLNGLEISKSTPRQLASVRSVLPQSTQLTFPFTVFEVVKLGCTAGNQIIDQVADLIEDVLDRVGLAGFGGRYYQELSGGEQQRVQFARVLAQIGAPMADGQSRCLMLDEPISSLDIKHQIQIMRIARDFADAGGGVVAVLHDLNLTAYFADHVVLINQGQVHAAGVASQVLTADNLERVYGCPMNVDLQPADGKLYVLPKIALATADQQIRRD